MHDWLPYSETSLALDKNSFKIRLLCRWKSRGFRSSSEHHCRASNSSTFLREKKWELSHLIVEACWRRCSTRWSLWRLVGRCQLLRCYMMPYEWEPPSATGRQWRGRGTDGEREGQFLEQRKQQNIATEKSEITANRHGCSTSWNIHLFWNVSLIEALLWRFPRFTKVLIIMAKMSVKIYARHVGMRNHY